MNKDRYEVKTPKKINRKAFAEVCVPGSKSITNRALLIAAMSNGTSNLHGCLTSDDSVHFLECLKALGFPVEVTTGNELRSDVTITGFGGEIPNKKAEIYVGSAGTAARFLVAMLAFSEGEYTVNSSDQMKKRPMQPLIETLRDAGATVECIENEGHFPLRIVGIKDKALIPESFTVNIDKSSQFLSALLIASGAFKKKTTINVVGSHGLSYVDLTAKMMKSFGVTVTKDISGEQIKYLLSGNDSYNPLEYEIEPDMSAAAYFYALAAILSVRVTVKGTSLYMLQGDVKFLNVLSEMGCDISKDRGGNVTVIGAENGKLKGGFTVDMSAFSDQALTLSAIAPFADAPITITGIGHIRFQECDRIKAILENLTALGIKVDEKPDSVTIYPGTPVGCEIQTYDDHRVAMSFALTGLKTEGIRILNPFCCKKTFAEYFDVLEKVIEEIREK